MVCNNVEIKTIENVYTSVGCNRSSGTFDWGKNGLVAFAARNSIAILDPNYNGNSSKIVKTLLGHRSAVTTVKWIENDNNQSEIMHLISGSTDGMAIIWTISKNLEIQQCYELHGHQETVNTVEAIYYQNKMLAITASADLSLKLWQQQTNGGGDFECIQQIQLNHLCFALKAFLLAPSNHLVLAAAIDDSTIRLLAQNDATEFTEISKLLGHEDWVRSLDIFTKENGEILLASASQDTFVRLWKITSFENPESEEIGNNSLRVEEKSFSIKSSNNLADCRYRLTLESVLAGHEAWVTEVNWTKTENGSPILLTSSLDKTLIIWTPSDMGIWLEDCRMGDVGGNSLGFLGGQFSANGNSILGLGFQGSFQLWEKSASSVDDEIENRWQSGVVVSGHYGEVRDVCWEPNGEFLWSVSSDQTTRIHAPWKQGNDNNTEITWHELARPQIHGYDMQCICALNRYTFASCGEEKLVRIFQAPGNFVENLQSICHVEDDEGKRILQSKIKGASVPSLGLSNKSESGDTNQKPAANRDDETLNYFTPIVLTQPATEATLMQNTLWPEIQKLYGHGYDVFALCATTDSKLIASSCKATTAEDAAIILWDTKTWKQIQKLYAHQLTVTQMKFSPDNRYLLSVGRDRRWSLFENVADSNGGYQFQQIASTDKKNGIHGRIIWTCDWSFDTKWFATGSRDGKIVAWHQHSNGEQQTPSTLGAYKSIATLELSNESITALAICPILLPNQQYLIAIGVENGLIYLYSFNNDWTPLYTIQQNLAHHLPVKKLSFRPLKNCTKIQLASCGDDNFVRIYEINV